jgi:glucose-1-phosphate cytidylyltransferase
LRVLVLCGGRGTRAYPHTLEVPKPLLEVADRPVVLHLMEVFAGQGFTDFVLAAGYKAALLEEFASTVDPSWNVEVVDTGEDSNKGVRVLRCADRLGDRFFCTYADGLGDVDLGELLRFHDEHPGCATLTTVPLPSQYGTLELDGDGQVSDFLEKPQLDDHLINAGFFVFDEAIFDHWPDPAADLEDEVLPALGRQGELFGFRHKGFWKSMDTYKEAQDLSALCADGEPPWLSRSQKRSDSPAPLAD